MSILSFFAKEMNQTLTLLKKTTVWKPDHTVESQYTASGTMTACVYSKALAEKYFGEGFWKESVKYVAVVADALTTAPEDHAMWNGTEYAVDSIDDVANQGEVILVALRGIG